MLATCLNTKVEISLKDELLDSKESMAIFTSSAVTSKKAKVAFSLLSWDKGSLDEAGVLQA